MPRRRTPDGPIPTSAEMQPHVVQPPDVAQWARESISIPVPTWVGNPSGLRVGPAGQTPTAAILDETQNLTTVRQNPTAGLVDQVVREAREAREADRRRSTNADREHLAQRLDRFLDDHRIAIDSSGYQQCTCGTSLGSSRSMPGRQASINRHRGEMLADLFRTMHGELLMSYSRDVRARGDLGRDGGLLPEFYLSDRAARFFTRPEPSGESTDF